MSLCKHKRLIKTMQRDCGLFTFSWLVYFIEEEKVKTTKKKARSRDKKIKRKTKEKLLHGRNNVLSLWCIQLLN